MRLLIVWTVFGFISSSYAQPNCFIYTANSGDRKACELFYEALEYPQGSRESQELFDLAIDEGPNFDWAYYEKSVPYFKRGFLFEGLAILNKAIELNPLDFLCYRAYWYWQYKNYELCIADLELYYSMPKSYVQTTPGGEKDMRIILGLAYAKTGKIKKGIKVMEDCLNSYTKDIDIGFSDYLSIGMLYYFNKEYQKAIAALQTQNTIVSDSAETYYFIGLAYRETNRISEAQDYLIQALETFFKVNRFHNINGGFRVTIEDIKNELANISMHESN